MRFAIVGEHRKVFEQNRSIHFEDLLSKTSLDKLKEGVEQTVFSKTHSPDWDSLTYPQVIQEGKDLAFQNEECKKIIHQKSFAELIHQLSNVKSLRYAFDQLIVRNRKHAGCQLSGFTLKDISQLQGTLFGLLLCIEKNGATEETSSSLLNLKEGDGLIFQDSVPLNLDLFAERPETYLLIVYAESKARIIYRDQASPFQGFKKYGYLSGDLLRDDTHPILIR